AEAAAVLASDVPTMEKLWTDDFTVNAPSNRVLKGKNDAIKAVKDGFLDYSSFERDVEAVLVHGDTVILMGHETVKPKGKAPFAGQTLRRRFTNIWMKRDGRWQLTARQATIIDRESLCPWCARADPHRAAAAMVPARAGRPLRRIQRTIGRKITIVIEGRRLPRQRFRQGTAAYATHYFNCNIYI